MTSREQEILKLVSENPLISQKDLAKTLGITRSSVGVHITNLQKKGYILGKGYIVRNDNYALVIGGANMDIQGFTDDKLILFDSNPGTIKLSSGGVGRNIAENISKLGIGTKFITALSQDVYGKKILDDCNLCGLDMKDALILPQESTSTYISMMNENRDMVVALSDMEIMKRLSLEYIKTKNHCLKNASMIVLDTNLETDVLDFITRSYNKKIFLDTVSTKKALKVKDFIGRFHTIKPNKIEAEMLSGIKIENDNDLIKVSEYFLSKGVKNIFITLGEDGLFYSDGNEEGKIKRREVKVLSATGAGDAFVSGLIYGEINNLSIEDKAKFSMGASLVAISHESTINPNFSVQSIKKIMKEVGLC